jgi:hypothetical protein
MDTKKVEIRLAALTRVEYTETLEVPADITETELNELVNQRYRDVDGGCYVDDPDYWERGEGYAQDADEGSPEVSGSVERSESGGLLVSEAVQDEVAAPTTAY